MQLIVFSIFAICIAGGQEIAIATEYLRLHPNETLSSVLGNYAQDENNGLPGGSIAFQPSSSTESSTAFAPNRPNNKADDDNDDSKEKNDGTPSKASYDNQGASITIDVHHILDIFKHELNAVEQRIIAAVRHHDHHHDHNDQQTTDPSSSATASYRIAPRILP